MNRKKLSSIDFTLILPCYNEGEHFTKSATRILTFLNKSNYSFEIIFVEDKSSDNTKKLIDIFIRKHPRNALSVLYHAQNRGRGASVMDGIWAARGKIVGFIDIDLEIDCIYIPQFIETIKKGYDIVCARRTYMLQPRTLMRFLASVVYKYLLHFFLEAPLQDTEAGYKFFKKNKILPLLPIILSSGWFWDTEVMLIGWKKGLAIKEINVLFKRRRDKTSTVRLIPDTMNYLFNLYQFKNRLLKL